MRDSRVTTAGPTAATQVDVEHPELSVRFNEVSSDLRAAIRHEVRGLIGSLALQMEIARRARRQANEERIGAALAAMSDELHSLSDWNDLGERWLIGPGDALGDLPESSSEQLATDLVMLMRVIGRRRQVTIKVEDSDDLHTGPAIAPDGRAAALCFCVGLLEQLAAHPKSGSQRRIITLRATSDESQRAGLWLGSDDLADEPSLRDWLRLQQTVLPEVEVIEEQDGVLLRWEPEQAAG